MRRTVHQGKNMAFVRIKKNTTWYQKDLSKVPAKTASLWYHIQYTVIEGGPTPIVAIWPREQNYTKLGDKCINSRSGQLLNKDLVIPLMEKYREKFWCKSVTNKTWNCYGEIEIQNLEPTTYMILIGYECGARTGNPRGLKANVILFDASNKTRCVPVNLTRKYPEFDECKLDYMHAAIPNQLGHSNLEKAAAEMGRLQNVTFKHVDKKFRSRFLKPLFCKALLPKCSPEENIFRLPCRDTCEFLIKHFSLDSEVNCNYLPSCQAQNSVTATTEKDGTRFLSNLLALSDMTQERLGEFCKMVTYLPEEKVPLRYRDACNLHVNDSSEDNNFDGEHLLPWRIIVIGLLIVAFLICCFIFRKKMCRVPSKICSYVNDNESLDSLLKCARTLRKVYNIFHFIFYGVILVICGLVYDWVH